MRGVFGWLKLQLAAFFSWLMRTRLAHRLFVPYLAPAQMWLYRRTGGRFHLSALLLPTLVLHSTGAKSGLPRETPLMCLPRPDGSFIVSGSNWGQQQHPGWTANLIAHPDAHIVFRRRTLAVHARLLEDAERDAAWALLEAKFPGYRKYETAANRRIRIFSLEPDRSLR
jgi:deazaflavin-dependent oxidoreductase (nitroreductase family)